MLFVVAAFSADAQKTKTKGDEPDKNISTFLNDGRIKGVNNLLRVRLAPTTMGYMGASYERKFGEKFGEKERKREQKGNTCMCIVM